MMTTKAYITKVPERGSNIFQVNVPLMKDNVSSEAIFDALLCNSSDSYSNYHVGDCVFVNFEDDKYDTAIILGKLYTKTPDDSDAYSVLNSLKVTGSAELPYDTTFGGRYSVRDFFNLYQGSGSGGGGGSINPSDLKGYVKWINTERGDADYYADYIRCMTGEEYDDYFEKTPAGDIQENVLYFLTSVPEKSEISNN